MSDRRLSSQYDRWADFFKLSDRHLFLMSDRRLGPEAPSVLADVGEPFITMSNRRLGPKSNLNFCLISASRLLHISVRHLGPEANLYVCLISASRLLQMSDRLFPLKCCSELF